MARRKKSAALHRIHGTDVKGRLNENEPEIDPIKDQSELKRPAWIHGDAREAWDFYLPILIDMGIITRADLALFTAYCVAVKTMKAAQKEIDENGLIVQGSTGPKKNPAITIQDEAMRMIRLIGADLGLTPASRPGLHANPPPDNSPQARAAHRLFKG